MGPISYTQFKVIANNSMIGDSQQVVLAGNRENPGLVSSVAGGKRRSFATPQDEAKTSQFVRSQLMNAVRKQLGKVPDSTRCWRRWRGPLTRFATSTQTLPCPERMKTRCSDREPEARCAPAVCRH